MNVHPPATGQPSSNSVYPLILNRLPSREDLQPFATHAERVPGLGDRAQKAVELACSGAIHRQPKGIMPTGKEYDRWIVNGSRGDSYQVSITEGRCNCKDAANRAPLHGYHRLCKHMLGCIFTDLWWRVGNEPDQSRIVQSIFGQAETTGQSRVQFYVRTFYTSTQWSTAGQRIASANVEFIDAYRFDDREWIALDHPIVAGGHVGEIDHPSLFADFWASLWDFSWQRTHNQKDIGFYHIWTFEPWTEDPNRQRP